VQAYKPDAAIHRILGTERQHAQRHGERERNGHNTSVYISNAGLQKRGANLTRLPVLGEIAAGQYDVTVAFQEYDCLGSENGVLVERALARGGAYALRVRGTSMTHVGIEPGDVVVIKPQNWADDGDFVVANYVEGEVGGSEGLATLKRFYKRRDHVFLQSATASTDPIRLFPARRRSSEASDPVQIQGVVTMVLKV
jgi:repressor LexA